MTILLSALAFILLLSLLIMIHEWGHFIVARRSGVVVEEFGFGLPPRAKTLFVQKGTAFTVNWIPFGGFVRLRGENALEEEDRTGLGSFGAASISSRIAILCAGVFMNFVLALALLTCGFLWGNWIPTYVSFDAMRSDAESGLINMELAVIIDDVVSGSPAAQIGIPEKSILVAVDNQLIENPEDVTRIQKDKKKVTYKLLTGEGYTEEEEFTVSLEDGKAGVIVALFAKTFSASDYGLGTSLYLAFREAGIMTHQTVLGIGQLFVSLMKTGKVPEGVTGLVGIAQLTHASILDGFMTYVRLVALLSLSLAVLNILPFPALDGGRLVFVLAELIARRPINRRFELLVNGAGFLFLLAVIFLITFYDILRLF
ncbi:MAG: site-2 protease family protein [Candidatus Peribacteraceae bacterium]|nr:site-2 protease family protein [Candidatus Peribacteraceae bacterium]